ncbi:solute carrier family 15 member 1-like isoform X3 [Daktulosphaira vitifoliae]|uniref:solute carrier family 15 member 1-like isoform X3 n=1 Tax=Daktulosphaira vitifoliae TaxID=58002 RepID=UPI0021A9A89F|nr:solute carrier family 15 member 1-like isoform X3 [Daktulosphaira vitifoliae]
MLYQTKVSKNQIKHTSQRILLLAYPKSVWFIICNEFCERFSYYGLRTVLVLYLTSILRYSDDESTIIYHMTVFLAYFSPLFGAILSDSFLGKFKTIMYLSIVYASGNMIVTGSSLASSFSLYNQRNLALLGLILIAIGTGGIKPCVSSFGGDQFILPAQEAYLQKFFSIFYFSINAGSLISTFLTPELRKDIQCFGKDSCFPLAFGVPAVLMIISIIVFVCGKPLYKIKKPESNVIVRVLQCVYCALKNKFILASSNDKKEHWLDYAEGEFSKNEISDIHVALDVIYLFIPFPFFWALFDQQGSRWTLQATLLNGRIDFLNWTMKPDQMQVVNPLFVLFFIPIFETVVYPALKLIGISKPLQKITLGGVMAALAFVCSAILQYIIMSPSEIPSGVGRMIIFNGFDCDVTFNSTQLSSYELKPLGYLDISYNLNSNKDEVVPVTLTLDPKCVSKTTKPLLREVTFINKKKNMYFLTGMGDNINLNLVDNYDSVIKRNNVNLILNVVFSDDLLNKKVTLKNKYRETNIDLLANTSTPFIEMEKGKYDVLVDGKSLFVELELLPISVNTLILQSNSNNNINAKLVVVDKCNIHVLWQLPQITLMTAGEIMFSITSLEFAFTQAPVSMKSLLAACNLLTVAIGNLIVVFVSEVKFFESQTNEYLLFAGLMILDIVMFAFMSLKYKYKEINIDVVPGETELEENKQSQN